jgi:hypothetical protein
LIQEQRHPHPHVDPRFPRDGAALTINPPHFSWKPDVAGPYRLQVRKNNDFHDPIIDISQDDPLYLPEKAFAPGTYHWRWGDRSDWAESSSFQIAESALSVEIPSAAEWLSRVPNTHPRIYLTADTVPDFRAELKQQGSGQSDKLLSDAEELLSESQEIREPEFLPDRDRNYAAFWSVWYPTMWGTRQFVKGAETLALAYQVTGDQRFGRAACERMASVAKWDPEGASYLGHNDEAHMSVIWHGPHACDWAWDQFTADERAAVIEQYRRRGQITFEHMHDRGHYGITRFDSHAGREIVFLANLAIVFHEHIEEAGEWLEWLRPVLCGMWPSWADNDGSWAQGPSYGTAYVTIMTMFASMLKGATGIDLYQKPFWKNHARWRYFCFPPYVEWMGFGDHSEKWADTWNNNANLVDVIARQTDAREYQGYIDAFREEAKSLRQVEERKMPGVLSQLFTAPKLESSDWTIDGRDDVLNVFEDAGWAAFRSNPDDRDRDIAMIFRSSPYGAISHSHANNNDFILHVGGKVMAMPSGYYAGYGSGHHAHWVWHTKSHNCVTLSDASQLMRSPDSAGKVVMPYEDARVAFLCGVADTSYQDRADRCRRHIAYLKSSGCFVMIDEFVGKKGIESSLQWNLHSWNPFDIDELNKTFTLTRDGSSLQGTFLCQSNSFYSMTEGWDPPPMARKSSDDDWLNQYHLRFTPVGMLPARNLGVVLATSHRHREQAEVTPGVDGDVETAQIGEDSVRIFPPTADRLAELVVEGVTYVVDDRGISAMNGE